MTSRKIRGYKKNTHVLGIECLEVVPWHLADLQTLTNQRPPAFNDLLWVTTISDEGVCARDLQAFGGAKIYETRNWSAGIETLTVPTEHASTRDELLPDEADHVSCYGGAPPFGDPVELVFGNRDVVVGRWAVEEHNTGDSDTLTHEPPSDIECDDTPDTPT